MVRITDENINDVLPGLVVFHRQLGFGKVLEKGTTEDQILTVSFIFYFPSVMLKYKEAGIYLVDMNKLIVKTEDYTQNGSLITGILMDDINNHIDFQKLKEDYKNV
jgi:hypothetical protein